MEVVNPRAALLSNYEVYKLLKELEAENLSRAKASLRIKKDEENASTQNVLQSHSLEASENLRTIEVEAIKYLQSDYLPTQSQTEAGIAKLTKDLGSYSLTKAEKLQIVNLAPTMAVELYVIVEELEDRFQDKIDGILETVKATLTTPAATSNPVSRVNGHDPSIAGAANDAWDDDADALYEEDVYVDAGEGMGVEGDLDMEDD